MRGDICLDGERFGERVQEYLRASGYSQQNLADAVGLHPGVLSRKLHGSMQAHITKLEVGRIIKILAQWSIITTRDEAFQLLALAHLKQTSLSLKEWQESPLNQLAEEPARPTHPTISSPVIRPDLPHSLPAPVTRLIGREWAVERLQRLLRRDEVRLVTLLGSGGSGKTRLALHVGGVISSAFAQGTWLVNLSEVCDAAQVPISIIQAFDLPPSPDVSPVHTLSNYLRDRELLLVLDDFEQVGEAAPVLAELLAAAPGLKILVTSRVVLHLYGEYEFAVPPLDVPDLNALPNTELLADCPAIQLFLERAQAVMPDIVLTPENGVIIAQICARLDGLPLALELAAARVKMLPPALLLERLLDARLPMLTGGARNLPRKLQTLRNTFEWSYNLLSPIEQQCFARLGVFRGSWSLEAASAILQEERMAEAALRDTSAPGPHAYAPDYPLDVLGQLVDNSLLMRQSTADGQMRFTMLETLCEYALERLAMDGELERVRDWHACYYLKVAETAEAGLRGENQRKWLAKLAAEGDNIHAALEWLLQRARSRTTINPPFTYGETGETASSERPSLATAITLLQRVIVRAPARGALAFMV